jgi:hypothetical protein
MSDIYDTKCAILKEVREFHKNVTDDITRVEKRVTILDEKITGKTGGLSDRITGVRKDIREIQANAKGSNRFINEFVKEVFIHLPAKKSNVPLDYHYKKVEKNLKVKPENTEQK